MLWLLGVSFPAVRSSGRLRPAEYATVAGSSAGLSTALRVDAARGAGLPGVD